MFVGENYRIRYSVVRRLLRVESRMYLYEKVVLKKKFHFRFVNTVAFGSVPSQRTRTEPCV